MSIKLTKAHMSGIMEYEDSLIQDGQRNDYGKGSGTCVSCSLWEREQKRLHIATWVSQLRRLSAALAQLAPGQVSATSAMHLQHDSSILQDKAQSCVHAGLDKVSCQMLQQRGWCVPAQCNGPCCSLCLDAREGCFCWRHSGTHCHRLVEADSGCCDIT